MFNHNLLSRLNLVFGLGVALTLVAGSNSLVFAQSSADDLGHQSNEKDPTYGDAPGGLNPLDLMHRAQQMNGRSADEFNQESEVQLNNSAKDYKQLREQMILEQQQQTNPPVDLVESSVVE
jgi:hypothetical protein